MRTHRAYTHPRHTRAPNALANVNGEVAEHAVGGALRVVLAEENVGAEEIDRLVDNIDLVCAQIEAKIQAGRGESG